MRISALFAAAAIVALSAGGAAAQQGTYPDNDDHGYSNDDRGAPNSDQDDRGPNGGYDQDDRGGPNAGDNRDDRGAYPDQDDRGPYPNDRYRDRDERYPDADRDRDRYPDDYDRGGPRGYYGGPARIYREDEFERECHRGNRATGTVLGAVAGGLIGGFASHGHGGAIVGGAILGGLFGNAIAGDIDCDDAHYTFDAYSAGLNGEIGRRYEWRHGGNYGYFVATREYADDGSRCRDFTTWTWNHGQERQRNGTACFERDGLWHFR